MTVLKDAASNALYGARGANGVILITTKRGKTGDARVTFDANGVSTSVEFLLMRPCRIRASSMKWLILPFTMVT